MAATGDLHSGATETGVGSASSSAGSAGSASRVPLARLGFAALLVFAVGLALYSPNLRHDFVFDDHNMIEANPRILSLRNWEELFTTPYLGIQRNNGLYRPVTLLTYAANFEAHRLSPGPYHFWNDFLHGVNSALVLLLTWLAFRSFSAALVAGGLFALHPIHSEAVHWVVGRAELLAALFAMVAICLVLTAFTMGKSRGWVAGALAAGCCLLAILSKENGAVAFLLVPLAILLVGGQQAGAAGSPRALWNPQGRFLLLLLALAGSTWMLLRHNAIGPNVLPTPQFDNPLAYVSAVERIATALYLVPMWFGKLILPGSLSVDYGPPRIPILQSPGTWQAWLGVALLTGWVLSIWKCRNKAPALTFWLVFLLVGYLPTSNLLFPVPMVFSERSLYMPSIAACALAGFAFSRAPRPWLSWAAASLLAVTYLAITVQRTADWESDLTLFDHEMHFDLPGVRSRGNYAKLLEKVDPNRAEEIYRDLISGFPDYSIARAGFGTFLMGKGMPAAALEQLDEAHRLDPDDELTLLNLGAAYAGVREWKLAVDCWERVLEMNPKNVMARGNLMEVRRSIPLDPD